MTAAATAKRVLVGFCLALAVVASMAQLNLVNVSTGVVGILPRANGGTGNAGSALTVFNGTNLEFGGCSWASNFFNCQTTTNGGTARSARFGSNANTIFSAGAGQGDIFQITGSTGNFINLSTGTISSGAAPATPLANTFFMSTTAFASLATPSDGTVTYCSDCTVTTAATCPATQASCVCAGSGSGATARRVAGAWYCTP